MVTKITLRPRQRSFKSKKVQITLKPNPKKVPVSVKSYVKRILNRNEEVKTAPHLTIFDQATVKGTGLDYAVGYGLTSLTSIVPTVASGSADGQRVGNILNVKKLVLRYTIRALPVTAVGGSNPKPALPFLCRVIVYRHRNDLTDLTNNAILDVGGSSTNLASTPDYWIEPYNKKEYIIAYSKQFLMQPITNNSGASGVADNVANGTKTFVTRKAIIKMPKKLLYNDAVSVPSNAAWYMAVAVCNTDGVSDLNTIYRAQVNAESFLYYTDA